MRDLAFVGYLALFLALGFRRPFLFVLGYVYIDLVSPQRMTYYMLSSVPVSLIFFAAAFLGWLAADDKSEVRFTPRQVLMTILLLWAGGTTQMADFPLDAAEKWDWVWKTMVFAIFLPLTLRTKLRIEALLTFMVLSAASIVIIGGIKTAVSGGGYGTLNLGVEANNGLYEGSTISTVAVAMIPMILYLWRFGTIFPKGWPMRIFCSALIFACLLIPVGTQARTGLICIGVLVLLILRDTKRRVLFLTMIGVAGLVAVPMLPSSFSQRMQTIEGYKGDESASTRIAVWMWTIDYAKSHPFGGGFGSYRQNKVSYQRVDTSASSGNNVATVQTNDEARAWHSSYFEMLGEQGYVGLAIWLVICITGIVRMEVLRFRYRNPAPEDAWIRPLATALQTAQILYMVGSLFLALAFASFAYMWIGVQIALDVYCARRAKAGAPAWGGRSGARALPA